LRVTANKQEDLTHVLEDTSAFTRAAEVANEFDNLTAIHKELKVARQQHKALVPVEKAGSGGSNCWRN